MSPRERRDERLGRELRGLDVPDHRPDFFALLAQRLEQEDAVRTAPAAPAPAPRPRRPRFDWLRPPMVLGAAAAAVLVVVLAVTALLPDGDRSPLRPEPQPPITRLISASEVRTRVSTALSSLRSLSGEVTVECAVSFGFCFPPDTGGRTTLRWSFTTTAAGDERVTGIGRRDDVSYSAARREQRVVSEAFGSGVEARIVTGLPAGPPDVAARASVLRRDVASVVRAFLATTSDVPVTELTEQGRPAWRLVTPVEPNKLAGLGASGDQLEVVVDRESGFPLRITETLAGAFLNEVRLSNLVVDGPVDPDAFLLELPAGVEPFRQDAGFRSVPLGQLAAAAGYQLVLPTEAGLPPGYRVAEVTVAAEAQATGTEGGNPPSRGVVSVAYRRGFDRIVVTTRLTGTAEPCAERTGPPGSGRTACWADPLASGEGFVDQPQRFTVGGGALAGARAELVVSPRGIPHVWTVDDELVVTVAGDANAEELRRMAESFAPAG
ncbi:MAG: LolA family protein [Acidimicrobiales bacterium]